MKVSFVAQPYFSHWLQRARSLRQHLPSPQTRGSDTIPQAFISAATISNNALRKASVQDVSPRGRVPAWNAEKLRSRGTNIACGYPAARISRASIAFRLNHRLNRTSRAIYRVKHHGLRAKRAMRQSLEDCNEWK